MKTLQYLGYSILTLLFAITPWIFNPQGKWIFELPKARALYICALLIIFFAIWKIKKLHTSRILFVVGIYLIVLLITGVLNSINPELAFWGTYTRQLGFLNYLHLFLLPFFLAEIMTVVGIRPIYKMIALGSLGTSLLALSQYTHLSPFAAVESFGFRLYGSFGEPNLLGYYLVLTLFPIWQILKELTWRQMSKYYYLLTLGIAIWTIIDSGSRGAMLALLTSIILICIQHSKLLFHKYGLQTAIGSIIIIALLGITVAQQIEDRHSFLNLRIMNNVTVAIRAQIWSHTIAEANNKWLLGHGLENLQTAFVNKSPELSKLLYDPTETIDRAHNDTLDHYYNGGLLGLLSYLILIGTTIFYSFRLWQKQNILVPLGITIQFIIISSLGPINSTHILFFSLALAIIHLAHKKTALTFHFIPKLLITISVIPLITYHLLIILQDFR